MACMDNKVRFVQDLSRRADKIMAESKKFCYGWRQKNSGNNSQNGGDQSSPPASITLKQPARGKRALLCCISYKKKKFELKGTIHDMKMMKDLLLHQFNFHRDSILILAERDADLEPTKKNIEDSFQWLMRGIEEGDSLLFYFSGHGLRQRNNNGDEIDGFDETICPLDFETKGMIFDDDINQTLVKPLIKGVTLHAIVDSCHSGTVLDLPLVYNINTGKWDKNSPEGGNESKGTKGGKAICFSACEDYQQAADTTAFSSDWNSTGAMTSTFIRAVKTSARNKTKISYRDILLQIHDALKKEDTQGCARAHLRRVFTRKIMQDPLLSSSEEFDANTEFKL